MDLQKGNTDLHCVNGWKDLQKGNTDLHCVNGWKDLQKGNTDLHCVNGWKTLMQNSLISLCHLCEKSYFSEDLQINLRKIYTLDQYI